MGRRPMIESISAITVATHDMPRAVRFYRMLGFEVIFGGDEAAFTSFRAGRSYLNLIAQPAERTWSWWGRVIFYHSDVDSLHASVVAAGYRPDTAPRDAEWGERFFQFLHSSSRATCIPASAGKLSPALDKNSPQASSLRVEWRSAADRKLVCSRDECIRRRQLRIRACGREPAVVSDRLRSLRRMHVQFCRFLIIEGFHHHHMVLTLAISHPYPASCFNCKAVNASMHSSRL